MTQQMTSAQVFDALEDIAATSGNEGQAKVEQYMKDPMFVKVVKAAYDPFITYGIGKKSLPAKPIEHVSDPTLQFDESGTWGLLNLLKARNLTGRTAQEAVMDEIYRLCPKSSELLKRILIKDLRAGFTAKSVNKAVPGTIITFECMLAHSFKDHAKKVKYPVAVEPKLDGVRVLAFVDVEGEGSAIFYSRTGKEFTSFDHLKQPLIDALKRFAHATNMFQTRWVLDTEVVSGSFNKTVSEVRKKDAKATDAVLWVFDMLTLDEFERESKTGVGGSYRVRRALLDSFFNIQDDQSSYLRKVPSAIMDTEERVYQAFEAFRKNGLEGAIVKDITEGYYRKRSKAWLKMKAEESVDVRVVGAFEGEGKYAGMLGGLVVDFNGVKVNVGGGFSDEQRKQFWYAWNNPGTPNEFDPIARSLLENRMIEVEYHEITPDGSLRHPRFVRFRDDKDELLKAA